MRNTTRFISANSLRIMVPVILLICIASFYLIRYFEYSPKSFNDLLGTNEANITKVYMGIEYNYVETTDKNKIKEILNLMNDRYYKKSFNKDLSVGGYYIEFYRGDKRVIYIYFGDKVNINDTSYNVSKAISFDSLHNWFKSLPVKDKR